VSRASRDAKQPPQAGARERIADLIANAEKAAPRRMPLTFRDEPLPNLGV